MIHWRSASIAEAQTPEINYPPRTQITFKQHAKSHSAQNEMPCFSEREGKREKKQKKKPPPKTVILNTISPNHTKKHLTEKSQQITIERDYE